MIVSQQSIIMSSWLEPYKDIIMFATPTMSFDKHSSDKPYNASLSWLAFIGLSTNYPPKRS